MPATQKGSHPPPTLVGVFAILRLAHRGLSYQRSAPQAPQAPRYRPWFTSVIGPVPRLMLPQTSDIRHQTSDSRQQTASSSGCGTVSQSPCSPLRYLTCSRPMASQRLLAKLSPKRQTTALIDSCSHRKRGLQRGTLGAIDQ